MKKIEKERAAMMASTGENIGDSFEVTMEFYYLLLSHKVATSGLPMFMCFGRPIVQRLQSKSSI